MNEQEIEVMVDIILSQNLIEDEFNELLDMWDEMYDGDGNDVQEEFVKHLKTQYSETYPKFEDWSDLSTEISFRI